MEAITAITVLLITFVSIWNIDNNKFVGLMEADGGCFYLLKRVLKYDMLLAIAISYYAAVLLMFAS